MKKTLLVLIIITPLLLFVIYGHGDKKVKHDELTKELEFYLEQNVTTGIKAILQRDSLDKINNLSSHAALLVRIKETRIEIAKQNKQMDNLRKLVLSGE